jgi:hypothetical protein
MWGVGWKKERQTIQDSTLHPSANAIAMNAMKSRFAIIFCVPTGSSRHIIHLAAGLLLL